MIDNEDIVKDADYSSFFKQRSQKKTIIRKITLVGIFFFFFNSFGLPHGLLYSAVFSPLLILWLRKKNIFLYIFHYGIFAVLLFCVYSLFGIDYKEFSISIVLYFTLMVFGFSLNVFLKRYNKYIDRVFSRLVKFNFWLFLLSLVLLLMLNEDSYLWSFVPISANVSPIPRLKMFTYEPSYYALLLVPLILYYLQFLYYGATEVSRVKLLIMAMVPFVFALSYGAIGIIIACFFVFLILNLFSGQRRIETFRFLNIYVVLVCISCFFLLVFFDDSPLLTRVYNILNGKDTSVNGRSFEAYSLAYLIIREKSELFGVGPGQVDVAGQNIINFFYDYMPTESGDAPVARLPSSVAESFATFGFIGLGLRFFILFYLFVKTRVRTSSYRFMLFIFMFIYQFVGSFTTSVVELSIWVITFTNIFPDSYFKQYRINKK